MTQASSARQTGHPSNMSSMPLRHWTDTQLATIAQRLSARYEGWGRDWMSRADYFGLSPVRVSIAPAVSARLNGAHLLLPLHAQTADAGAPHAWIGFPLPFSAAQSESITQVAVRMVFGEPSKADTGGLAAEMGLAALDSLATIMRAAAGIPAAAINESALQSDLPQDEFHAWSGCVKVSLPASGDVALYLNGAAVSKLLDTGDGVRSAQQAGGLTPLQEAASRKCVGVNVRLNPVDLTVGQLKSLQIGDVVILPHPVEEPLCVVTPSDELLFKAYLGRSADRRALQAVRSAAPAKPAN